MILFSFLYSFCVFFFCKASGYHSFFFFFLIAKSPLYSYFFFIFCPKSSSWSNLLLSILNSFCWLLQHHFGLTFRFPSCEACGIPTSLTRNWTQIPHIGRWSLNHWTTREVPLSILIINNIITILSRVIQVPFCVACLPSWTPLVPLPDWGCLFPEFHIFLFLSYFLFTSLFCWSTSFFTSHKVDKFSEPLNVWRYTYFPVGLVRIGRGLTSVFRMYSLVL